MQLYNSVLQQSPDYVPALQGCVFFVSFTETKVSNLVWDLINMQSVLNHVSDRLSHLTGKRRKIINFQRSVRGGYYTALSYDVIYDVFVLFTFASWTDLVWYFGLMFCILTRSQTDIFLSQTRVRDCGVRPNWPNILSHQINCMSFNSEKTVLLLFHGGINYSFILALVQSSITILLEISVWNYST